MYSLSKIAPRNRSANQSYSCHTGPIEALQPICSTCHMMGFKGFPIFWVSAISNTMYSMDGPVVGNTLDFPKLHRQVDELYFLDLHFIHSILTSSTSFLF